MIKVLIVEDDKMLSVIHKKFVETIDGFEVIGVTLNGKAAYEIIQNEDIDLLILDIYLPGMNGFELLKKMRKKGIMSDVILVTAANEVENISKARSYGVFDYLVKPFEYDRLKISLQKYLQNRFDLNQSNLVNQKTIDKIFNAKAIIQVQELSKGLHEKTLKRVLNTIEKTGEEYLDIGLISEEIDISRVTTRRYLDYLGKIGEIEIEISQGLRGRPSYIYKIKNYSK